MNVTIRFSAEFRERFGAVHELTVPDGARLFDVLHEIADRTPDGEAALFAPDGTLRDCVIVLKGTGSRGRHCMTGRRSPSFRRPRWAEQRAVMVVGDSSDLPDGRNRPEHVRGVRDRDEPGAVVDGRLEPLEQDRAAGSRIEQGHLDPAAADAEPGEEVRVVLGPRGHDPVAALPGEAGGDRVDRLGRVLRRDEEPALAVSEPRHHPGASSYRRVASGRVGQTPKRPVERYRSPVSGKITTIVCPAEPGRAATSSAAWSAAPDEMPARIPSSRARRRAVANASSSVTCTTSSTTERFSTSGTKPAPIPWIRCGPGLPPERTGEPDGSTAIARNEGLCRIS